MGIGSGVFDRRPSAPKSFAMGPEHGQLLLVYVDQTLKEWTAQAEMPEDDRPPLTVVIHVQDTFLDGISDTTEISFVGLPIRKSDTGEWIGGWVKAPEVSVGKTERKYPNLTPLDRKYRILRRVKLDRGTP